MTGSTKILLRSLLRPFYRENGGLILFLIFIMFAAVGRANDTGLLEYHYALIIGIYRNADMLLLVFLLWLLYAFRGVFFVHRKLQDASFVFLAEFARLKRPGLYLRLLLLQVFFFLPVLVYGVIIVAVGLRLLLTVKATGIAGFLLLACVGPAGWYLFLFSHPGWNPGRRILIKRYRRGSTRYWQFLWRYVMRQKKALLLCIKLSSGGMLWAVLRQLEPGDDDLRMPILFYTFGLLGHAVFIFHCRELEESGLNFYRGLPVSIARRFFNYAIFYFVVFLPETVCLASFIPTQLSLSRAMMLFAFGYGLLLLLNSLLFIRSFKKTDFLKLNCALYLFVFIGVLAGIVPLLTASIVMLAMLIFYRFYYRFETTAG